MPRTRGKRGKGTTKKEAVAVEEVSVENEPVVAGEPDESIGSDSQNTSLQESLHTPEALKEKKESAEEENVAPKDRGENDVSMTETETAEANDDLQVDKNDDNQAKGDETMETNETKEGEVEEVKEKKQRRGRKPAICYKPHTFPVISNKSLLEKWEWHLKFFPIDQSDIRSCILESVSKIAQETWLYIDKQNFGMGSYDMCVRTHNDAAMIMLKTLAMPLMYRYLTVEITRRAQDKVELERIAKAKEEAEEDSNEEDESENLPYTEVSEKATLLLDFMHTPTIEKVKGQEKKRCLYVKYLPEGTTKEFLKVLFPVANNLDIVTTGEGRRVGSLNVSSVPNIFGICNAYVAVRFEGNKTIALDWREENLDDGIVLDEVFDEIPWEIIPRQFEYPYETVPEMTEDDYIEYAKRRRNLEDTLMGHDPKERDRDRRRGGREMDADVANVIQMQCEMNEKITSQIALLSAVEGAQRAPPSLLGVPPLMSLVPGEPPFLRGRDERRDGRGERDRRNSGGRHSPDRRDRRDRRDRSKRRDRGRDGRASRWDNDGPPRNEREKGPAERDRSSGRDGRREDRGREEPKQRSADRGRGPGFDIRDRRRMFGDERVDPFDMRFPPDRFDRPGSFGPELGGHFPDERQRFEMEERNSRFEMEERRRRGPFQPDDRMGRFDPGGMEGPFNEGGPGLFPSFDRGPFDPPEMDMGRGRFGNRGRGRMEDRGRGRFDEHGRGGRSEEPSFGGQGGRNFERRGRGGMGGNAGNSPEGRFDTQAGKGPDTHGRGGRFDRGGRGSRNMGRGGFGKSGPPASGDREGSGNQKGFGGGGGGGSQGGFGSSQDGRQWMNASQQPTPATSASMGGSQPTKQGGNAPTGSLKKDESKSQNQRQPQGAIGSQDSFRKESGNVHKSATRQQGSMGMHSSFGNQQQNTAGTGNYGNQPVKAAGSQSNFAKQQQNTNAQMGGFGTQHNSSSGFGSRQNTGSKTMTGNQQNANLQSDFGRKAKVQGGYSNQQNMNAQSGYGNQPKGNMNAQSGYGNQPKGNMNAQSSYGNQPKGNTNAQSSYSNQPKGNMNAQSSYGNQPKGNTNAQSSYGNQPKGNTNAQSSYSNQPKGNRQDGFGGSQSVKAQTGYGNQQQSMLGTQGGFGNQQMNQSGYSANQATTMAQNAYSNLATNPGQGSYTNQQNAYTNQQTGMNNQQNSYGMSQDNTYGNQAYGGYGDNIYNQNYLGAQQSYGNYDSSMWSQNIDYSQYGAANYATNQTNTYSSAGTQAQQMPAGNVSASNTVTGYGAGGMGYSADASYAAQGYYNAGQSDSSMGYGAYGTQDTSGYNMGSASTLATYDFASYNNGSS